MVGRTRRQCDGCRIVLSKRQQCLQVLCDARVPITRSFDEIIFVVIWIYSQAIASHSSRLQPLGRIAVRRHYVFIVLLGTTSRRAGRKQCNDFRTSASWRAQVYKYRKRGRAQTSAESSPTKQNFSLRSSRTLALHHTYSLPPLSQPQIIDMDAFFTIAPVVPVEEPVSDILIDNETGGGSGTNQNCVIA